MRQLQVVGVSDDGEALLLGQGAGKPSHRLRLDDQLRAAVRGQLAPAGAQRRTESALTPKEMQARLREGSSPEEVAKEAGIPVERVLPYAAPVIAERDRIVEQARAAMLHRSRGPNGEHPLGDVVDAHLADMAGFKSESVEWTARRRRDGAWVVLLGYAARGGRRTASWLWRPAERDLTALDASATRLAAEETSAPRRRVAKPPVATAKKPAKKSVKKAAASKPRKTARRPVATKAATATVTVKKAATKRAAATRKAVKPARPVKPAKAVKPVRAVKPATTTKRAKVAPSRPTVVPDPVLEPAPAYVPPAPPIVVIPRPEPDPEPQPEVQPELQPEPIVARRPGQRVPLPSWSDVLLGVSPPEGSRDAGTRRRRKSG